MLCDRLCHYIKPVLAGEIDLHMIDPKYIERLSKQLEDNPNITGEEMAATVLGYLCSRCNPDSKPKVIQASYIYKKTEEQKARHRFYNSRLYAQKTGHAHIIN